MTIRTTVALEIDLLKVAKQKASLESRSLGSVVNEALRRGLASSGPKKPFRLKLKPLSLGGSKIDIRDRSAVYDTLEDRDRRKFGRQ